MHVHFTPPRGSRRTLLRSLACVVGVGLLGLILRASAQDSLPTFGTASGLTSPSLSLSSSPSGLEACLAMARSRQPAHAAARASLAAAESGRRGLDSLRFASSRLGSLFAPDLPIRKEQASLGISIAAAGLQQAEWETRYAVARTYWTVQYARAQLLVIDKLIDKLERSNKKAKRFVDAGDPDIKVTKIDIDSLALNIEFAKAKRTEVVAGVFKGLAGLREAIGLCQTDPLDVPEELLPALVAAFDKDYLRSMALAQRGEMAQARAAAQVAELEICAQSLLKCRPTTYTFAAGADLHAKPIPQGVSNGEYRPGAIGMEMPTMFAGRVPERAQRAADFSVRARVVVDKTSNLIALEVEAAYLKWQEASEKAKALFGTIKSAQDLFKKVESNFDAGKTTGEELMRARTQEDYAQANYNEALFNHAVALATIERVTAGGYRMPTGPTAALLAPEAVPAPKTPDPKAKKDGKTDAKTDAKTDGKSDGKTDPKTDAKTDGKLPDGKTPDAKAPQPKTPEFKAPAPATGGAASGAPSQLPYVEVESTLRRQ